MTKKRIFIALGILFWLLSIIFTTLVGGYLVVLYGKIPSIYAVIYVFCGAGLFCLAEGMFLLAKVVPKILRIIIYFQWAVCGAVLLITPIWFIFGDGAVTLL